MSLGRNIYVRVVPWTSTSIHVVFLCATITTLFNVVVPSACLFQTRGNIFVKTPTVTKVSLIAWASQRLSQDRYATRRNTKNPHPRPPELPAEENALILKPNFDRKKTKKKNRVPNVTLPTVATNNRNSPQLQTRETKR